MASSFQNDFSRGELAPALHGRVDAELYRQGLKTARNTVVHTEGGISNRPGLRYLGPVKTHTYAPYFRKFQFKTTDTYMLEFGNLYMRVIRENAHVLEAAKTITAITQASPAVVTSAAHGYVAGNEVYIAAVIGMTVLNGRRFVVANPTANTFELKSQITGANVDTTTSSAYSSGGTVARVFELATPYAIADVRNLKFAQSGDVITLTHKSYAVRDLARLAHDSWTLSTPSFLPSIGHPTGMTVAANTVGAVTVRYRVTAVDTGKEEEGLPALNSVNMTITAITQANPAVVTSAAHGLANGDEVHISGVVGMTQVNSRRFIVAGVTANTFQLSGENSTAYTAYSSAGTANRTFTQITNSAVAHDNTVSWTAVTGAGRYVVYRQKNGIYGTIGETENVSFVDILLTPDLSLSPPAAKDPFRLAGTYPGTVGFYEQRKVYGGSTDAPDTTFYSKIGSYNNFSSAFPTQADDPITASLADGSVSEIRHFVSQNDLIVFTGGGEWRVSSGQDSAFSAETIKQKSQSKWGSSHLAPQQVGKAILFVRENESELRSLGYDYKEDGYVSSNMNLLASHMFEKHKIVDYALIQSPQPLAICVRADGKAAVMAFDQEQNVIAWNVWDTDGTFESVGVCRALPGDTYDTVYFVVKRTISGNTVRYVEFAGNRFFSELNKCFFVDSGVTFNTEVAITGVSATDPVVVTATAHGMLTNDIVDLFDIVWDNATDAVGNSIDPGQLNGARFKITVLTADTFSLATEEGVAINGSAFVPYLSGGHAHKTAISLTGLWHLVNTPVAVLADGNVLSDLTVSNAGTLTFPRRFSHAHVGLAYISDVETLDIEDVSGATQGKKKKVTGIAIRLDKSRGLLYGPEFTDLTELKQREFEAMGEPTALFSGVKNEDFPPEWSSNGRACFRQKDPLPMTILAIAPELEIGG